MYIPCYLKSKNIVDVGVKNGVLSKILVCYIVWKMYKPGFGRSCLESSLNGISYKTLLIIKENVYPKGAFLKF